MNDSKLRDILQKMEVCLMSSYDDKKEIHTRPMAVLKRKESTDPCVYFYMKGNSQVGQELKKTSDVRLSFMDQDSHQYASFRGESTTLYDEDLKEELWTPVMKSWFPEGIHDPELELVEVKLKEAQLWDSQGVQVINLEGLSLQEFSAPQSASNSTSQEAL